MPLISNLTCRCRFFQGTAFFYASASGFFHGIRATRGSSAHIANKGGRGTYGVHGSGGASRGRGRGSGRGCSNDNQQRNNNSNQRTSGGNSSNARPLCQVCFKKGHTTTECWHRFDENYVHDEKLVAAASSSYNIDTNWYMDSGATDHVTSDLEKAICSWSLQWQGSDSHCKRCRYGD